MNDLKVGRADRDCIDPDQDFSPCGNGHRLVPQGELIRVAENPGFHAIRDEQFG
ncbi:hypothetical protein [Bradyrhizobium sp. OAE829]|uniref:hypothetical protein n=1 Tax=Bradyrhizobium sp. OAE829 TaxID=2663807 RepID=UPI001A04FF88